MAPNIYLAAKKVVSPTTWFRRSSSAPKFPKEFHANHPVPGVYAFHSLYGLVLLSKDSDGGVPLPEPIRIKKSEVTKEYYLMTDWLDRTTHAVVTDPDGDIGVRLMFRLDDEISWVACEDENGHKIVGPWPRYCRDQTTRKFRLMLKGDSPEYRTRVSVGNKERAFKAEEANKEPVPLVRAPLSHNASPQDTPGFLAASSPKFPAGGEVLSSPELNEPPTPVSPGGAPFMLPGPAVMEGDQFSTKDLDAKLEKLKFERQDSAKA